MKFSQIFSVLDSRMIKIIAVFTMTVDHIGVVLFPNLIWLRIIGRISFPLFAFLIAYGCIKTRNIGMYFLRLIAFACFLQIFWISAGLIEKSMLPEFNNIFFTLAFGVGAVWLIRFLQSKFNFNDIVDHTLFILLSTMIGFFVAYIGGLLRVDYGMEGIILIIAFFAVLRLPFQNLAVKFIASVVVLTLFNLLLSISIGFTYQWYSMLTIIFIWLFKDRKIKAHFVEKYAFYIYYPLHFVVLYLILLLVI